MLQNQHFSTLLFLIQFATSLCCLEALVDALINLSIRTLSDSHLEIPYFPLLLYLDISSDLLVKLVDSKNFI